MGGIFYVIGSSLEAVKTFNRICFKLSAAGESVLPRCLTMTIVRLNLGFTNGRKTKGRDIIACITSPGNMPSPRPFSRKAVNVEKCCAS